MVSLLAFGVVNVRAPITSAPTSRRRAFILNLLGAKAHLNASPAGVHGRCSPRTPMLAIFLRQLQRR